MGVHLKLSAISDCNVDALLRRPRLIWTVIFPEYQTMVNQAKDAPEPTGRVGLLPEPFCLQEDLGEYWHGLHYLICKEVWSGKMPEAFLLDGGSYVGDIDVGYGPARLFDSQEVKMIAQSILNKKPEDLVKNFDANVMQDADVYPATWDGNEQALAACLERFAALQHFLRHTVENERGLMVYLSRDQEN